MQVSTGHQLKPVALCPEPSGGVPCVESDTPNWVDSSSLESLISAPTTPSEEDDEQHVSLPPKQH